MDEMEKKRLINRNRRWRPRWHHPLKWKRCECGFLYSSPARPLHHCRLMCQACQDGVCDRDRSVVHPLLFLQEAFDGIVVPQAFDGLFHQFPPNAACYGESNAPYRYGESNARYRRIDANGQAGLPEFAFLNSGGVGLHGAGGS
jgi:hypothetical protein